MKLRPLHDRVIVKRLDTERKLRLASSFPTTPLKNLTKAKSSLLATEKSRKTARFVPWL